MKSGTFVLVAASGLAALGVVDCGGTSPRPRGTGGVVAAGGHLATGGRGFGGFQPICPNNDCCNEGDALPSCMGDYVCRTYSIAQTDCSPKFQCNPTPCPFGCYLYFCLPDPSTTGGSGHGGMGAEGGLGGGDP